LRGNSSFHGTPHGPELKQTVANEVLRIAGNRTVAQPAEKENEILTGLLNSRAKVGPQQIQLEKQSRN
jgi:hypothetical protein